MIKILNIYLLSSDWQYSHRKSYIRTIEKRLGKTLIVQYPISLIVDLFIKFKKRFIGFISGKYKPLMVESNIEMITPIILFHKSLWSKFKLTAIIDSKLIAIQVNNYLKKKYPLYKFNLWVYVPADYYLTKFIKYDNLIYDYYDDSEYDYQGEKLEENINLNRKMIPKCDLIICISEYTTERIKRINNKTIRTVSGFDSNLFCNRSYTEKNELDFLDKPVVGYSGALRNWINFEYLIYILEKTDYYLVCIGYVDRKYKSEYIKLKAHKRFLHIGYMNIEKIPNYLKKFNVGILPYVNNNFTKSVFPYKFFEYMSMGIPIVSSSLPELKKYDDVIGYSYTKEEFLDNCIKAVNGFLDDKIKKYDNILSENTWDKVFDKIEENLKELYKKRFIHKPGEID